MIFFRIFYNSIIEGDENLEDTEYHKNTLPNYKLSYRKVYSDSSDDDSVNKVNAPITPYNIRYWWFFLSRGNRWIEYRAHPKIRRPKLYQLTFASLIALDGFRPLLSTQLTADLTLECSDGSIFHPSPHIAWKNPYYCAETAPNSTLNLNRRRVVVFDQLWAYVVHISNRAFSCSNLHAKWWIHCLLISLRCQLSHATPITIG